MKVERTSGPVNTVIKRDTITVKCMGCGKDLIIKRGVKPHCTSCNWEPTKEGYKHG